MFLTHPKVRLISNPNVPVDWKSPMGDFFFLLLMKLPLYGALALLVWKLAGPAIGLLTPTQALIAYVALVGLMAFDFWHVWQINSHIFTKPVPEMHRYKFKQVAVLNVLYFATFGSELAVVSMLPLFLRKPFFVGSGQSRFGCLSLCLHEPDVASGRRLVVRPLWSQVDVVDSDGGSGPWVTG